jgi:excisionase family DNA binding protein
MTHTETFSLEQVHSMLNAAIKGVADKTYSLKEVAERTGFALDQLQRDVASGRIPHVRRGNARRMTPQQVADLIASHLYVPQSAEVGVTGISSVRSSSARAAGRKARRAA